MHFYKNNKFQELRSEPTPYDANTKGISLELGQYDTQRNSLKLALHAKEDTQKELKTAKTDVMKIQYFSIVLKILLDLQMILE